MARTTIDYGIDLGTTNSSIAVLTDTTTEVITHEGSSLLTPSVIWFDKRGRQYIGQRAKNEYFGDTANGEMEFKRRMGQDWRKTFERSGIQMRPEEMSGEILKSLKADVRTAKGEDLQAAVITVPAAFDLPQCDATRRAAEVAGLSASPLLQEPVAAALAYGFQSAANKVFWLVYDFGGGTFDAAIIQVRDGVIQVVNHAGDNYLGGTNIDWDIVDKVLLPQLKREYQLQECPDNHSTDDVRWKPAMAKLKYHAEAAKIQVSRSQQPSEIFIEDLCVDAGGESVDFEYELTPADLESLIEPRVEKSIGLCQKALEEKGLSGQDIEKTLLVGGTSLFPWLQERVAAALGTPLDFTIDPLTVVSRGAAVFAGSQRLAAPTAPTQDGVYTIQLEYDPVGHESDPMVGGKVFPPSGGSLDGFRVELVERRSQWSSGAINLATNGTFMTAVHAEKGRKCEYDIILTDVTGTRLSCTPEYFTYTVGMPITSPPLTHDLGIALANNESYWLFRKGGSLPDQSMRVFRTVVSLRKEEPYHEADNVIRIPLIEGDNPRADRNRRVRAMEIRPDNPQVKRDVPAGSEVEVKMTIDESRTTQMEAFIPLLDEVFKEEYRTFMGLESAAELERDLEEELSRLSKLEKQAAVTSDGQARVVLEQLQREQLATEAQRQLAAARSERDADLGEVNKKLLDLKAAVDSVEDVLEWPSLVREAREQIQSTHDVVDAWGQATDKARLDEVVGDIEGAITARRPELLRARVEDLRGLGAAIVVQRPEFWVDYYQYLEQRKDHMRDQKMADDLFAQGRRAIQAQSCDLEALKAAVRQLIALLPPAEQKAAEARGGFGSTVVAS